MVHQPQVSVIIPTYNRADILRRAIGSVQRQTYPHIEILVVDDYSSDHTGAMLEDLRAEDSRIKPVHNTLNKGSAGARTSGIKAASGNYTAFLDDDDEYCEEKIARQVHIFEENGDVDVLVDGVSPTLCNSGRQNDSWVAVEFHPHQVFQSCSVMCKRDVLHAVNVRWGNMEWRDLAFEVYITRYAVWFSSERLFRINTTASSTGSHSVARYRTAAENALRYYQGSRDRAEHEVFKRYLEVCYKNLGNYSLKKGSLLLAGQSYWNAYTVSRNLRSLIPFT